METYYYLYRITNLINGKIYVGVHKTNDLEDGYMGSGKVLSQAIEKYGIEHFNKEIVQFYDSAEEMFNAEAVVVNADFINDPNTYNLKLGGNGGWDVIHHLLETDDEFRAIWSKEKSNNLRMLHQQGKIRYDTFVGKRHTDESKTKIGAANSKHQSGSGNSQYGKMWIYNEDLKECTRIPKDDPIPEGWKRGRKMKF